MKLTYCCKTHETLTHATAAHGYGNLRREVRVTAGKPAPSIYKWEIQIKLRGASESHNRQVACPATCSLHFEPGAELSGDQRVRQRTRIFAPEGGVGSVPVVQSSMMTSSVRHWLHPASEPDQSSATWLAAASIPRWRNPWLGTQPLLWRWTGTPNAGRRTCRPPGRATRPVANRPSGTPSNGTDDAKSKPKNLAFRFGAFSTILKDSRKLG